MANNEQNTFSGGAGAVTAPSGNFFLDAFTKLASVAVTGSALYEDAQDRKAVRKIELANATRAPQMALPASQSNSPADYLSNPENVQRIIFYGVGLVLVSALGIWVIKKI